MLRKFLLIALVLLLVLSVVACSQKTEELAKPEQTEQKQEQQTPDYPTKPIKVLIGFKPGGGSDALAQLCEPFLEKILGVTFINQYIPGATGAIAWTQLAHEAKNDGYTISVTNTPMLMTNYIMNEEITYNIKDFEPLANIVTDPGIIVVGKDSKFRDIHDFLEYAKNNPGQVTVGNSGVGGDDFFTTLIVERETGIKFEMVPFQGDGPSWQAAMAGKIDASFNNLGITYPQIKAGNLRALALFAEERTPMLPDVPTLKELGYNVVSGSSRGFSAPKGIPDKARETLIKAIEEMSKDSEFNKAAAERAMNIDIKLGEEYRKYLEDQEKVFIEIWDEIKDQYKK